MQNFSDFWKTFTIWREESVSQTNRKTMRIFFCDFSHFTAATLKMYKYLVLILTPPGRVLSLFKIKCFRPYVLYGNFIIKSSTHRHQSITRIITNKRTQHTFGEMMKPFIEWDMRSLTLSLKLIVLCLNFKERKNRNEEVDFSKTKFLEEFDTFSVWTRENCVTDLLPFFPRSSKVGTLWTYAPPMAAICIEQYWNWQLSVWMIKSILQIMVWKVFLSNNKLQKVFLS